MTATIKSDNIEPPPFKRRNDNSHIILNARYITIKKHSICTLSLTYERYSHQEFFCIFIKPSSKCSYRDIDLIFINNNLDSISLVEKNRISLFLFFYQSTR